jgi:futalosine hydrolase
MRILVVSATQSEAAPLQRLLRDRPVDHEVFYLVTGIGMTATAYSLTRHLLTLPVDFALNIGLSGSFRNTIPTGSCVWVKEDVFADLGAEDGSAFLDLATLGFQDPVQVRPFGFDDSRIPVGLQPAKGATVNTVHGDAMSIRRFMERENADIESMEGAAFYYVCEREQTPSCQLRAISNYVEPRNRAAWKIPEALESLSLAAYSLIRNL